MSFNSDVHQDNEIVGYYNGKYIIKDEIGEFFFLEAPEGLLDKGEVVSPCDIKSINVLPISEREEIKRIFS